MEDNIAEVLAEKEMAFKYFSAMSQRVKEEKYAKVYEDARHKVKVLSDSYNDSKRISEFNEIEKDIFDSNMKMSVNNLISVKDNGKNKYYTLRDNNNLCPSVMIFDEENFIEYLIEMLKSDISEGNFYSVKKIFNSISIEKILAITKLSAQGFIDETKNIVAMSDCPFPMDNQILNFSALYDCNKLNILFASILKDNKLLILDSLINNVIVKQGFEFKCVCFIKEDKDYYMFPYSANNEGKAIPKKQKPPTSGAVTSGAVTSGTIIPNKPRGKVNLDGYKEYSS